MSTKALVDELGLIRRRHVSILSNEQPRPHATNSRLPRTVSTASATVSSTAASRCRPTRISEVSSITVATPKELRHSSTRSRPVSSIVPSAPAPHPTPAVNSAPPDTRKNGQCTRCLRAISLTAAGLIRSHGPNCSGSGQPPVYGSVTSTTLRLKFSTQSSLPAGAQLSDNGTAVRSSADIMELLRHRRCRVLKRIPKASRIPAADKLAETLRQVVVDPDSVDKWVDLLTFTFACFGVPGQRGGRRRLNCLASKVNAAVAIFPASSAPVQQQKPPQRRQSSDVNLAARVSSKLEDGDIQGAIRLAASDDTVLG